MRFASDASINLLGLRAFTKALGATLPGVRNAGSRSVRRLGSESLGSYHSGVFIGASGAEQNCMKVKSR